MKETLDEHSAQYWYRRAADEREFARQERRGRLGTVESIRVHEENAAEYERYGDIAQNKAAK